MCVGGLPAHELQGRIIDEQVEGPVASRDKEHVSGRTVFEASGGDDAPSCVGGHRLESVPGKMDAGVRELREDLGGPGEIELSDLREQQHDDIQRLMSHVVILNRLLHPTRVTVPSPRMAVTAECRAKLTFGVVLGARGMVREAREWWWSAVGGAVPRVTVGPCRAERWRFLYLTVAGTCFALAGPAADLTLIARATAAKRVAVTMDGRRDAGETERRGQHPDGGHPYGKAGLRRDEEGSDAFGVTFMIDDAGKLGCPPTRSSPASKPPMKKKLPVKPGGRAGQLPNGGSRAAPAPPE